jgi:hypothetical protein
MPRAQAEDESSDTLPEVTLPSGAQVVSVEVFPESIELTGPYAYRQVLILGTLDSGETIDLTRLAKWNGQSDHVKVTPEGIVRPLAEGSDALRFRYADQELVIPYTVSSLTPRTALSVSSVMSNRHCLA